MLSATSAAPQDTAVWCCELELSGRGGPRSVLPPAGERSARVLVRLHGEPLGYVTAATADDGAGGAVDLDAVVREAHGVFAPAIAEHLRLEGVDLGGAIPVRPPAAAAACPNRVTSDPLVSVVVCTRNRSTILVECLERLRALTHPHLEVVVVDNAPDDGSTREAVRQVAERDSRFRYVVEPRPGLSSARNAGLEQARGTYVAYTDDDVAVDPGWVQGLLRGFARRPDVGCVTGLVCTAGITGAAEAYFDARASSWSTRCEAHLFDLRGAGEGDLYPYSPGIFGTGANVAFVRTLVEDLGGFDEALGAGTRTRGGEDLDAFVRVLRSGSAIAYQPSALVWHHHRADRTALLRQMFGYGTGLTAFLTKCVLSPRTRWEVLRRVPLGALRVLAIRAQTRERLGRRAEPPRGALLREYAGFAAGPVLYVRARHDARRPVSAGGAPR